MGSNFDTAIIEVPLSDIVVGRTFHNIRRRFPEGPLAELAEKIQSEGLMSPLVVMNSEDEDGKAIIELVAGERRLRAIQHIVAHVDEDAFKDGVPCVQYVGTVRDAKFANASENIDREDVGDVDTAAWLYERTEEGISQAELARRLHRSAQWVSFRVTFHERACDELKEAVQEGLLPFTAGYEMAKNLSQEEQAKRIKKARKFGEKITLEEAQRVNNPDKNKRPSKKKMADTLASAEGGSTDFHKGFTLALRWALGMNTDEDIEQLLELATQGKL